MRVPSYRLHKASGQALVTIRGKDHYLGKHDSEESRQKYDELIAKYKRQSPRKKIRKREDGPSYRLHSRSNQAVVTLNGKDYYLGPYGSKESKAKYHRLKSEFIASGKSRTFGVKANDITIIELVADYATHCEKYYGTGPESEVHRSRPVLRVLKTLYATLPAIAFGPLQYEAVRVSLMEPYTIKRKADKQNKKDEKAVEVITRQRFRRYINALMKRVRAMFKWASSKSILPVSVLETLKTVEPLKIGRTEAPELGPILPVSDELVDATLPHLNHVVKATVQFQRLVGCRPGEVCRIKPSMVIDRSAEVWEIKLEKHKTAYKGKSRTIYCGPKAQAILKPFMLRGEDEYCFSPADAMKRISQLGRRYRWWPLAFRD